MTFEYPMTKRTDKVISQIKGELKNVIECQEYLVKITQKDPKAEPSIANIKISRAKRSLEKLDKLMRSLIALSIEPEMKKWEDDD